MLIGINISLIFIGIICVVVGLIGITTKKEKIEKIVNLVLTSLGVVTSLLGAGGTYYTNVLKSYNLAIQQVQAYIGNMNAEENVIFENSINSNNNINSNNQITNNTVFEDANSDQETLLNYAQFYYLANNYEGVARVYGNSLLANNPVALTNLGYMYANGIYFQQNFEIAENYYNKAIELGYQQAMANKVAMYLKYKLLNTELIIAEACESRNVNVGIFLAITMDRITDYSYMYISDFGQMYDYHYSLGDIERIELIENMYFWEDVGLVTCFKAPTRSELEIYEFIRLRDIDNSVAGLYRKYERRCYSIDVLDECFIIN